MDLESIKNAEPGKVIWDDVVKGLHLRVFQSKKQNRVIKSFYAGFRLKDNTQRRVKVGEFPETSLTEARKNAKSLIANATIGIDLKGQWDKSKEEKTVGEMYHKTLSEYWDCETFKASNRLRDVQYLWKNHISKDFENLKLSKVSAPKIRAWHAAKKKTPTTANRALSVLSRIFSYAEEMGEIPQYTNPCKIVKGFSEKSRRRYASKEEIAQINMILKREFDNGNQRAATFLFLLLNTGSRPRAIERATWDQISIHKRTEAKEIIVSEIVNGVTVEEKKQVSVEIEYAILKFDGKSTTKTGDEESVIIPPAALEMLKQLPRMTNNSLTSCKMPKKLWLKIKEEVGCHDLWARDLRRTFATVALSSGESLSKVGELLNHKSTQTTKIYAKLLNEEKVKSALSIAEKINSL